MIQTLRFSPNALRQRMEMQGRYNSSPRLRQPPVLAPNLAVPGPSSLQVGQGAPPTWNPEQASGWDRLLSEQDGGTHRTAYVPTERDRYHCRPPIQHRAPNIPDPTEGPVRGAELRRRRMIRAAHEPHAVWEEPRVVNSTKKQVLDTAAHEWSPEDVALCWTSGRRCSVILLDFPFAMGKAGKAGIGSMLGRRGGYWSSVGLVWVPCLTMRRARQKIVLGVTCGRGGGHDLVRAQSYRVAIGYIMPSSSIYMDIGTSCIPNHQLFTLSLVTPISSWISNNGMRAG